MSLNINIKSAVYGGGKSICQARDISRQLQNKLDSGQTKITFDNTNFSDTCPHHGKGFAITAEINGQTYLYAGPEGNTIDFSQLPVNGQGKHNLQLTELVPTYLPAQNQLFSQCECEVTNIATEPFPNRVNPSAWVWIDFYLVADIDPLQEAGVYTRIGEVPLSITPALSYNQSRRITFSGTDCYDMARYLLDNRHLVSVGEYYLYVQVRNSTQTIDTAVGRFSAQTFHYILS
jgi:hypothetical protein